jgi:hypothetical protein
MGRCPDATHGLALVDHRDDDTDDDTGYIDQSVWTHVTWMGRTAPAGRPLNSRHPASSRHVVMVRIDNPFQVR